MFVYISLFAWHVLAKHGAGCYLPDGGLLGPRFQKLPQDD
jgi:hypothetical protein